MNVNVDVDRIKGCPDGYGWVFQRSSYLYGVVNVIRSVLSSQILFLTLDIGLGLRGVKTCHPA